MSDDRELLEFAAKAAGIEYNSEASKPHPKSNAWFGLWLVIHGEPHEYQRRFWNPLTDDGDALRLAVKLNMGISVDFDRVDVSAPGGILATEFRYDLPSPTDPCAATRRAIVRAAAEIGKSMS